MIIIIITRKKIRESKREEEEKDIQTKAKPRTTTTTAINTMQSVSLPVNSHVGQISLKVKISIWHRNESARRREGWGSFR